MTRSGNWEQMPAIITDEMLEQFVPRGTYAQIAAVFRERYAGLAKRITFPLPENREDDVLVADVVRQLQAPG
jgi:hypothetical protein